MKNQFLKAAAASFLGISIFTASFAVSLPAHENVAYAKTAYKILKGKLVNAASKKIIKGYAVYGNKLYYNGNLKKGYAVSGNRLYYDGSLKKGYAVYGNKLYYNGSLKKGYSVSGNKLYYNGSLKEGYAVSGNKLYYNGSLKSGYATYSSKLYKNGTLFTGTVGNKQYKNGVAVKTPGVPVNAKIRSISSHSGSIFTNFTVAASPEVYKVTLGSFAMHYDGHNTFSYALTNVKAGTAFTVCAYDENNKLLQTIKYTVK